MDRPVISPAAPPAAERRKGTGAPVSEPCFPAKRQNKDGEGMRGKFLDPRSPVLFFFLFQGSPAIDRSLARTSVASRASDGDGSSEKERKRKEREKI